MADDPIHPFELKLIWPEQTEQGAPCSTSCPSGSAVRQWIGMVAQRSKLGLTTAEAYRNAWELIVDVNPFPATMGRICPHPCEAGCNREGKDGAVAVNQMERFLGDWAILHDLALPTSNPTPRKEAVAVIGAGPAGLSFAYQMARRGYEVAVYDRNDEAGGMLRYGIPDYRLPAEVLNAEIQRITDLGVTIHLGVRVGTQLELEELRRRYDIIFVGIGAQLGRRLGIPGEEGSSVWTGTEYLHQINLGREVDLGNKVVVVGGGNTAIDAARTARRYGSEVTLLYRRSRAEMPASDEEVEEAIEEGVDIKFLVAPTEIERKDGVVDSITVQRMHLGEPDSSGRRRPIPIPESGFRIPTRSVISAVSQMVDLEHLDALDHKDGIFVYSDGRMNDPLIVSGGDVGGAGIASLAIGQGRAAAEAAHARFNGTAVARSTSSDGQASPKLPLYEPIDRVNTERLPASVRLEVPNVEVSTTISEGQFLNEAERCLSCGSCFGCQHCWTYCNAGGFMELDRQEPGKYFSLDLSVCEGCGKCIEVCPCGFLTPGPSPKA